MFKKVDRLLCVCGRPECLDGFEHRVVATSAHQTTSTRKRVRVEPANAEAIRPKAPRAPVAVMAPEEVERMLESFRRG